MSEYDIHMPLRRQTAAHNGRAGNEDERCLLAILCWGFADKVSFKSLLMLPAQPLVIILYLHNEITKKILKRFCGNAIIHIILIGINCSKTLLTT